jgi:hypothetical protein
MHSLRTPFFLLLVLTACAAAPPVRPWKIEVTSSGGFAGNGNGAFTVDSNGALRIAPMGGRTCDFTLSADELSRIETLLAKASPRAWKASYLPENTCCDRFHWKLTLTQAKRTYTTEWLDDLPPEPKELVDLVRAIIAHNDRTSLRSLYEPRCR